MERRGTFTLSSYVKVSSMQDERGRHCTNEETTRKVDMYDLAFQEVQYKTNINVGQQRGRTLSHPCNVGFHTP